MASSPIYLARKIFHLATKDKITTHLLEKPHILEAVFHERLEDNKVLSLPCVRYLPAQWLLGDTCPPQITTNAIFQNML